MKITLSKKQWEAAGKKAGWLIAQGLPVTPETSQTPVDQQIARANEERLRAAGLAERFPYYFGKNFTVQGEGQIQEVFVKGNEAYVLLKDGSVDVDSPYFKDVVTDKERAKLIWDMKDADPTDKFCEGCGTANPHVSRQQVGLGETGVVRDSKVALVTDCCQAGLIDKFGNEKKI